MANTRKKYNEAENVVLLSQVNRVCPLCDEPLFYKKGKQTYKNYEIAHIYPLNPTQEEIELLRNEARLSDDVNDERNAIALCEICHGKFDKPRTVHEYQKVLNIKEGLIKKSNQEFLWKQYKLEGEISNIIKIICESDNLEDECEITYDPQAVDKKLDSTINNLTKRKIKNNVTDYYVFIKKNLSELDKQNENKSESISLQIKLYYLKQCETSSNQQEIFENIARWITVKSKTNSYDAAEIVASFFVQNCEIFK